MVRARADWLRKRAVAAPLVAALLAGIPAQAQELEPGVYQNAPLGVNVVFGGYGYSVGNVLFDAAMPIVDADATVHGISFGYLRTLGMFGKSAKLDAQLPVSWAHFEGVVAGEFRTRSPQGLADPRVRLSVNLIGAPALDLPGFARYRPRTIAGASLQVVVPLGQYDATRAINLGANRWAFRPEAAVSHVHGRWILEASAGAWLFTDNTDYFGGSTLAQRPLYYAKGGAIYTFRRNLWVAAGYGRATGGRTRLDDVFRNDLQRNDRIGATLSVPLARSSTLRIVVASGLTTRLGADFDSIGFGYQYSWGGRSRAAR